MNARTVRSIPAGDVELACISVAAARPGPSVVVTAGVHGDEWTGTGAVELLAEVLQDALVAGTVHLYPSLNPAGRARGMRRVPDAGVTSPAEAPGEALRRGRAPPPSPEAHQIGSAEGIDLNRCFPGHASGNVADRLAHAIWTDLAVQSPDLVLDLHADSPWSVPYVLLDRAVALGGNRRRRLEDRALALAEASGWTVLHDFEDARYARARLDRSLSGCALNLLGVPAMTLEAGPRGVLEPSAITTMLAALRRLLVALGNLAPDPADVASAHPSRVGGGPWRREIGPLARATGSVVACVPAGRIVARGDLLAEVRDEDGSVRARACAETEGFVVSHLEGRWVTVGSPVCTWATREGA